MFIASQWQYSIQTLLSVASHESSLLKKYIGKIIEELLKIYTSQVFFPPF